MKKKIVEQNFVPCAFVFHFSIMLVTYVGIKNLYVQLNETVALRKTL